MLAQMDALNVGPLRSSQFKKPFTTTSDGTLNLTANVTDTTCVISGGLQYITDVTNIGIPLGSVSAGDFCTAVTTGAVETGPTWEAPAASCPNARASKSLLCHFLVCASLAVT